MSKRSRANFKDINYGKLYTGNNIEKYSRVTKRELSYPYDEKFGEYNILDNVYDRSFYKLSSYDRLIREHEHNRPDLVSYNVYGDTDYYHYILRYNRIADPIFEVESGKAIKIPVKEELETWIVNNILSKRRS